ncbi:MAG: nucleotide exchange factor GrpE [Sphingobacteriales bacterium]|nr:MAG: nucleotide exchange factor GrpE [Sphingobacteriales bacterium]
MTASEIDMEEAMAQGLNTDDSVSGMQHLEDGMEEEDETEKLKAELAESKDQYLRLVAEFDNFRKRSAKEYRDMSLTAGKEIIQSLLVVLDDTERAEKQLQTVTDISILKEGISLVFNKLKNTMQQKGLKAMESIGQPFNADLHEAITEIPAANDGMVGKVMDEVEKGYYLNDKLIRHAKVVVGK